jgi:hypothetical protein
LLRVRFGHREIRFPQWTPRRNQLHRTHRWLNLPKP